jgi:hypothetical protein
MGNNLDTSRTGIEDEKSVEFGYVDRIGEVDRTWDTCKGCSKEWVHRGRD